MSHTDTRNMLREVVVETNLPFGERRKGKVRDIYDLGDKLLIVATDRISAFDYVLPTPIPNKGVYLTQLSLFWFKKMETIVKNHVLTANINEFPEELQQYREVLEHRSMLVKKAEVFPIECIVRGYLSGSGWRSYKETGEICGIKLPPGLKESEQLDEPLFTPSTKAEKGHDENISFKKMQKIIGKEDAEQLKELSIKMYEKARDYAKNKGIIIADTKFEFGKTGGEIIVVDELLTPDSSRFWPLDKYEVGKPQPSFDKQYVRDYLLSTGWDRNSQPPSLPEQIVKETEKKYGEAYEKLTGEIINI